MKGFIRVTSSRAAFKNTPSLIAIDSIEYLCTINNEHPYDNGSPQGEHENTYLAFKGEKGSVVVKETVEEIATLIEQAQ